MSRVDLFSLITQFTRSTDTRRSSRAHRGVRGALVPGLVTESRADGLESRRLCGPGGYHPWSRPEQHRAEYLQVCRSRSGADSEAKTLAQVKPRSRSRRAAASTTTSTSTTASHSSFRISASHAQDVGYTGRVPYRGAGRRCRMRLVHRFLL